MVKREFYPRESLERALARWWVVVLTTALGGIAGWSFHFFQPPVYEATAVLTINMDFSQRELTQFEQDYAFGAAGAVIGSTSVVNQVVADAQSSGIPLERNRFVQHISWEAKQSEWELRVRDQDPQVAAKLANAWVEVAYQALDSALEHAVRADQVQTEINALESCLLPVAPMPSATPPAPAPLCADYSLSEIQNELADQSNQLLVENKLGLGILPFLKFAIGGDANVPDRPVLYDLGSLALAGMVIGFVLSLWIVNGLKRQS